MTIINSQLGGKKPTGTKNIVANGTHNVADYEYADVQVPTTAPDYYILYEKIYSGSLNKSNTLINLNGITQVGSWALAYAYYKNGGPANVDLRALPSVVEGTTGAFSHMFGENTTVTSVDLSSVTGISARLVCEYMFYKCTNLVSVDLSNLESVWGSDSMLSHMFDGCTALAAVNLNNFKGINTATSVSSAANSIFYGCTALQTINLSSLEKITGWNALANGFYNCTSLSSVDLSSLHTINGSSGALASCFYGCSSLSNMNFYSLKSIGGGAAMSTAFRNCTGLTSLSFPALNTNSFNNVNQFQNIIQGVTGCTIHFPKNLDPQGGVTTISSLTGYPLFGGTSTVLAFDLPSTFVLTGANTVQYERNPKADTGTALSWRKSAYSYGYVSDWTPYYTSGTTDPTVGGTIYSDAACTTAVTTISSIA